jgi:hypothetical protein
MNMRDRDSISRLAVAFLEHDPELIKLGNSAFTVIEERLRSYMLVIRCGERIKTSVSDQAALLTAINVGKRCFKGGVYVQISDKVKSLLPWPEYNDLNVIAQSLGALNFKDIGSTNYTELWIGASSDKNTWRLLTNNWSCGVIPPNIELVELPGENNFPLGGIAGAALAVGTIFLKVAGFDYSIGSERYGISLWRPNQLWFEPSAQGPTPESFTSSLWLLGLGHLGQAYAWVIGFLPFKNPNEMLIKLQDDDRLVKGNYDSGMLSEPNLENNYKTRVVAAWLEARGISTKIVERRYDAFYCRQEDDPEILLGGLDTIAVRKILKSEEFKLILDCGLGAGLNFDMIRFNAFPNIGRPPSELWKNAKEIATTPNLKTLSQKLVGCGFTVGIASAFTGCFSACIMVSELLRSYNQGQKLSHMYLSLREISNHDCGILGHYNTEAFSGMTLFTT